MSKAKGWTCQKQSQGKVCKHHNPPRTRKCQECGKPRPVRVHPTHMAALDLPYEEFIKINGGEFCGICGRSPSFKRRLDRDHDHFSGKPRGLLCHICNRRLGSNTHVTLQWLRAAVKYLERSVTK